MIKIILNILGAYLVAKYIRSIWLAVPSTIILSVLISISMLLPDGLPVDFTDAIMYGMIDSFVWDPLIPVTAIIAFIIFKVAMKGKHTQPVVSESEIASTNEDAYVDNAVMYSDSQKQDFSDEVSEDTSAYCTQCGTKVVVGVKYCQNCGKELVVSIASGTVSETMKTDHTNKTAEIVINDVYDGMYSGASVAKETSLSFFVLLYGLIRIFAVLFVGMLIGYWCYFFVR